MTQKDKELLIKDICARLLYGVKMNHIANSDNEPTTLIGMVKNIITLEGNGGYSTANIVEFKPYLFPMSSMTEEQKKELEDTLIKMNLKALSDEINSEDIAAYEIDFYNRHHIDYRGIIPMGLAIDATGLNIY